MAHRLNEQIRRNTQLCRLNRAPVAAAQLAALTSTLNMTEAPILTVAMGDIQRDGVVVPLGSPLIRPAMANALGKYYRSVHPTLTNTQIKAIVYREMTMSVMGEAAGTREETERAQNKLKSMLRQVPPNDAQILTAIKKIWNKVFSTPADTRLLIADVPGLAVALGIPENGNINHRKFIVWNMGGHIYPIEIFPVGALRTDWDKLTNLSTPALADTVVYLTATEDDITNMTIAADVFLAHWRSNSILDFASFYESTLESRAEEFEKDLTHALFACLSHLTKGQNKTEAWIVNRFKRIQEGMSHTIDLNTSVLQEFSRMHSHSKITSEQAFAVLAASYKSLQGTPASSLCWIIDQVVASNIPSAFNVADIMSKMHVLPMEMIIHSVVPENQIKSLVRLAMHVIINRFVALTGPPVTAKEYADLAYLCSAIHKKSIFNQSGAERASCHLPLYADVYTPYLTKSKNDLEAVATTIHELSAGVVAKSVPLEAVIRRYFPDCSGVFNFGGDDEMYFDLGARNAETDEDINPPPQNSVANNLLPPELRKTGRYYRKQSLETLIDKLQQSESDKTKAFRSIMSSLSACGMPSSAFFGYLLKSHYQLPYMAISDNLKTCFDMWLGEEARTFITTHDARTVNVEVYPRFVKRSVPPNA